MGHGDMSLYLSVFVAVLGFSMVAPIFPLYVLDMGASYSLLGVIISIYGAVQLVTQIPAGRFSDRVGRKPLLLAGLVSFAAMPIFYIFAKDAYTLVLIRAGGGIGASMVWPVAMALLLDHVTPTRRGTAMGWYNAAFYSALAIGPAIGGVLYDTFGLASPFIFWSVLASVSVVMVATTVKEPPRTQRPISTEFGGEGKGHLIIAGYMATFLACCSVVMWSGVMGSFNLTLLPSLASSVGLSISEVGFLYMAYGGSSAVCNVYFGRQADRGRRKLLIFIGCAAVTVSFSLFSWATTTASMMFVLMMLGFGSGMATPAATAIVANVTDPGKRGEIFGIFNTARMMGVVIGPLLAGFAADAHGVFGALYIFLALAASITLLSLVIREGRAE